MTTETPQDTEQSMEDILASIRQIIAGGSAPQEPNRAAADDDILELTDIVEEMPAPPQPTPMSDPIMEAASMIDEPMRETPPVAEDMMAPPADDAAAVLPKANMDDSLVAPATAAMSADAFAAFARAIEDSQFTLPPNTNLGDGGISLEQVVNGLLRPLLKDWLDTNLPAIVERHVQREIERIARRNG